MHATLSLRKTYLIMVYILSYYGLHIQQKMTQNHFLFIMRHILYMLKRIKVEKNLSWNEVLRNQTQPGKENNTVPDEEMDLAAAHEGQAGSEEEEKLGQSVEDGGEEKRSSSANNEEKKKEDHA